MKKIHTCGTKLLENEPCYLPDYQYYWKVSVRRKRKTDGGLFNDGY